MTPQVVAYLVLGSTLVLAFGGLVVFTFGRRRKDRVEAPKHRMLEDDDGRPDR